ncbi:hypothetical protein M231_07132 [Tremella mesenterica]|uniref:Fungal lipase-type domain-containing protein n=1 Tax=Tremella mesenterica TaxID=5217 RepID=A0A4Q1BA11_TREME|nr:hypothetical protein M231_07132 [Tremella mesenterica]
MTSGLPTIANNLTPEEISSLTIPGWYATAAYCSPEQITSWTCGAACRNLLRPTSVVIGGNGEYTPRYFISNSNTTITIAISGTNVSSPKSYAIDLDFPKTQVDVAVFPGADGAEVHQGFYSAFQRIALVVGPLVQGAVTGGGVDNVIVTGHSLGGALSQLMATYLQKILPQINVTTITFASPRVGNQAWANYVDTTEIGNNSRHIINYADDVPHVPPRDWGFVRPSGEIWIMRDGKTYRSCVGQEDPDCADSLNSFVGELELVDSFLDDFDTPQHRGPYAGVL